MDSHSDPQMIQFRLKISKYDQYGSGTNVVVGRTGTPLCPVMVLTKYLEVRGDQPGAFFLDSAHKLITKPRFVSQLREILSTTTTPLCRP